MDKFDESRGYKFATYATECIHNTMQRGVQDTSKDRRIPNHVWGKAEAMLEKIAEAQSQAGRELNTYEQGEVMGIDPEKIIKTKGYFSNSVSLDAPPEFYRDHEETDSYYEIVASQERTEDEALTNIQKQEISEILDEELDPYSKEVLILRFHDFSQSEIARRVGSISRQAIYETQKKAFIKLRTGKNANRLRSLLDKS